jgi:hypothetical protein
MRRLGRGMQKERRVLRRLTVVPAGALLADGLAPTCAQARRATGAAAATLEGFVRVTSEVWAAGSVELSSADSLEPAS